MAHTQSEPWRQILPGEGGTVGDLQVIALAGQRATVLALTPLGVFSSDNRGMSWGKFIGLNSPPLTQTLAIGYDSRTAGPTILLGSVLGLYRATPDYGTWDPIFTGLSVEAIGLASQIDSDSFLLAATVEKGLLVSEDGGITWDDANAGLNYDPVVSISSSPLYRSDRTIFLATDSDIFRSRNGGKAWRRLGFDVLPQSIRCMSVCMGDSARPVVLVGSSIDGLWSSVDSGDSWKQQIAEVEIRSVSTVNLADDDERVLVVTGDGLCLSTTVETADQAWQQVPTGGLDVCCSVIVPATSSTDAVMIVGQIESGVARKQLDKGEWTAANRGLEASSRTQLLAARDGEATSYCLIVSEENRRLLLSRDGGDSWISTEGLPSTYRHQLSLSQRNPLQFSIVAASENGAFEYSDDTASWITVLDPNLDKHPLAVATLFSRDEDDYTRLVAVMEDGEVMYRLPDISWVSAGRHFGDNQIVAAELIPSWVNARSSWAIIYSINDQAGLGHPSLWNTQDSGITWTSWVQSSGSAGLALCVTSTSLGQEVVFIGIQNVVYKIGLDLPSLDRKYAVERESQALVGDGNLVITAIDASPDFSTHDTTLFIATNQGIHVSRDAGTTFERWTNDGPSHVLDIQFSPAFRTDRLVYALELGGSVWRRADLP